MYTEIITISGTHQELMANKGLYYEMNQIDQASLN